MCFQILVRFVERVLGGLTFRARYGVIFGLAGLVFGGPAGAQLLPKRSLAIPQRQLRKLLRWRRHLCI